MAAGRETDEGGDGETGGASAGKGAEAAKPPGAIEGATIASGCDSSLADEDRKTIHLTARVEEEVGDLQRILYHFPKTPGGVPDAFRDDRAGENAVTLEKDGVEEDHDRNRSNRRKDSVVITVDD